MTRTYALLASFCLLAGALYATGAGTHVHG